MLSIVPQTCPFTARARPSTQARGRSSSTVSAALHRPQATLPVRVQEPNCAREAKCTCGKTKRPPNCDGSHAKRSKAGSIEKSSPSEHMLLTAENLLRAQEQ